MIGERKSQHSMILEGELTFLSRQEKHISTDHEAISGHLPIFAFERVALQT